MEISKGNIALEEKVKVSATSPLHPKVVGILKFYCGELAVLSTDNYNYLGTLISVKKNFLEKI